MCESEVGDGGTANWKVRRESWGPTGHAPEKCAAPWALEELLPNCSRRGQRGGQVQGFGVPDPASTEAEV